MTILLKHRVLPWLMLGEGLSVTSYGHSDDIEPGRSLQTPYPIPGLLEKLLTMRQLFTTVQSTDVDLSIYGN